MKWIKADDELPPFDKNTVGNPLLSEYVLMSTHGQIYMGYYDFDELEWAPVMDLGGGFIPWESQTVINWMTLPTPPADDAPPKED